jgi:hypothetical protein
MKGTNMLPKSVIDREIRALKKLKPFGPWTPKTAATIQRAIDELQEPFDRTSEEWNELPEHERDMCEQVERWKVMGRECDRPSQGWEGLAK